MPPGVAFGSPRDTLCVLGRGGDKGRVYSAKCFCLVLCPDTLCMLAALNISV